MIFFTVKEKSPLTSELTEEIKYMSVTPSEMTSRALTQYQTKVKVTSIMDAIIFTLRSHGYLDLSHGNKIEEKVTFLTQMLNSKNAIWIQQNADFSSLLKDLLLTVSLEVKTRELKQTSLIKIFSRLNPFTKSASQQLDAIDHRVSVSYHLIKDSWRKCIKCKKAFFTPLGSPNGACMWCKSMLISKPDFTI